jgi:hypothetical protein
MLTKILLLPLMVYAALGLVLSLAAHVLAYAGIQLGGIGLFTALHVGIFPLWIPVVLIAGKMTGGMRSGGMWGFRSTREFWNATLADSPVWMKYMTFGFLAYAFVNFILFMALMVVFHPNTGQHGAQPPALVWRGFSGHWMAFYSGGLAILTAAYRRGLSNLQRCCVNGHPVAYGDRFCSTCGAPLETTPAMADRAVIG